MHEKTTSPRSSLRWKQTGIIFKTVGLRWVPTGKIFTSSTTKVDSEPRHGSNINITNLHECIQTLDSSAGTSINVQEEQNLDLSAGTPSNLKKERIKACIKENVISRRPRLHGITLIQEISARQNSQAVNKIPTHYPCDYARIFRVILFSIHSDKWKSFQCQHQTALRYSIYTVKQSSRNQRRCYNVIPVESDSLPHAHIQALKTYIWHQDSRIIKAQEIVNLDEEEEFTSFHDDAKYKHVGQDTRSQDGKDVKDKQGKDLKISD
ncbi:hypothetical protein Tco_0872490 [Tanacetum coccineum]